VSVVEEGRQARLETSAAWAPVLTLWGWCRSGPLLGWSWAAARVPARRSPSRIAFGARCAAAFGRP